VIHAALNLKRSVVVDQCFFFRVSLGLDMASSSSSPSGLDEDKVEKAVSFLLHPSVRGSAEESKRAFLLKKGLSQDEIEEAFLRTASAASGTGANADANAGSGTNVDTYQNTAPIPSASMNSSRVGQLQHAAPNPAPGYSFTNVVVGIGFAAAAAYSIKTIFGPSISRAAESVKVSLQARARDATDDGNGVEKIGAAAENGVTIVEVETDDDVTFGSNYNNNDHGNRELIEAIRDQTEQLRQSMELLIRSSNAGKESISELREELRSLNDRLDEHGGVSGGTMPAVTSESAPMSYMQVLEMLEQGRPIPGIRDDINDKPPNPDMSPTASRMQRRAKPWDTSYGVTGIESNDLNDVDDLSPLDTTGSSSRRDLSGATPPYSIYESVTKTPDKHRAIVAERASPSAGAGGRERQGGTPPWRPPPIPKTSLSD